MALILTPNESLTDNDGGDDSSSLWAWMAVDDTGRAGIIAGHAPGVGMVTLVTTNEAHARGTLREAALLLCRAGRSVELRRYDLAEVVERP